MPKIDPNNTTGMRSWIGCQSGRYYLVQTMEHFREFFSGFRAQHLVAVDTETSGLNWVSADACGLCFGWGIENNYYLPINHKTSDSQLNIDEIRADLASVLGNPSVTKVFWNATFDRHFLAKLGLDVAGPYHDGVVLVHLLDESRTKSLKEVACDLIDSTADRWEEGLNTWRAEEAKRRRGAFSDLLKHAVGSHRASLEVEFFSANPGAQHVLTRAELTRKIKEFAKLKLTSHPWADVGKSDITYDEIPLEIIAPYAAADVHYTLGCYKKLILEVAGHDQMRKLYVNEMELSAAVFEVEEHGVQVDVPYLKGLEPAYCTDIANLRAEIFADTGGEFNIDSSQQLVGALQRMGCALSKVTKAGDKLAIDKEVLEGLAAQYEFAHKILEYREKQKLLNTYVLSIRDLVDKNERLHSTFNTNVSTGRMSSKDPNCFSRDTEVLTPDGWTRFDELKEGVPVAQWCAGAVSFVVPLGYTQHHCSDPMVYVSNGHIDLLMTQNHECLLVSRAGIHTVVSASEYPTKQNHYKQINAGVFAGGSWSPRWQELAFLIAVQADGSYTGSGLDLGFRKTRKIERLEQIFQDLDVDYRKVVDARDRTRFYVKGAWASYAKERLGPHKRLGSWLLSLSRPMLDFFCREIFFWDGCWTRRNHYASMDRVNADWAQTVLVLSDLRTNIRKYVNSGGSVSWQTDVTTHNYSYTDNAVKQLVDYNDTVFCLKVPSGAVLVRRHGKVCVTKQCQNIPAKNKDIRKAFVLPKGNSDYVFVFCDYSQVELRLTAHHSQDPILLSAYPWNEPAKDVHTITCAEVVMGRPISEVEAILEDPQHPEYDIVKFFRGIAKRVNFGIIYGAGPKAIQRQVSTPKHYVSEEDCAVYIKQYFERYQGVANWIAYTQLLMRKQGFLQNTFGRYRRLPEAISSSGSAKWAQQRAFRQGVNFLIQGDAADLFKHAVVRVRRLLREHGACTHMVNFVHDEIQFYLHKKELHLLPLIKEAMESFPQFRVPIIVEVEVSHGNWGSKKSIKTH